VARARAEAEQRAKAEAEQRAKAEALVKAEADAKGRAEQVARARALAEAAERVVGTSRSKTGALALATPQPLPAPSARASSETLQRPRYIRELGFKLLPDASSVFVRLSGPPMFSIAKTGRRVLVIELPNTTVERKNDARSLDASFFPGAVATVTPKQRGTSTIIEIALKESVAYRQRVEGDTLAIDFDRPAAP
jgi:hypothetical protein